MKAIKTIMAAMAITGAAISGCGNAPAGAAQPDAAEIIGKSSIKVENGRLTPEALWAMGRIGAVSVAPDASKIVYGVSYYSVPQNKSHHTLHIMQPDGSNQTLLTTTANNESSPVWIKNGTNLTLRDLKDRLNHAVAIMVSLKNKSYENNSAANFEACTSVAYLESQYPNEYYRLIKNEESFAKFIQASYTIVNDATIEEDTSELVEKFSSCFGNGEYTEEFIKSLCGMVMDKIFKDDFRMYFYTYPKTVI